MREVVDDGMNWKGREREQSQRGRMKEWIKKRRVNE